MTREEILFDHLCWSVECHMATLSFVRGLKRTAASTIRRHQAIVARGLEHVRAAGLPVPRDYPQVKKAMDATTKVVE